MKRFFISLAIFLFAGYTAIQAQNQNVSINNDGSLPDNSAMLDVSSTTKGLLIPRMTSVQKEAISSPATGLIVFDTDNNNFWYFDGTQWTSIDGGGTGPSGLISSFDWDDAANLITITENGTSWQITVDNEADDLTDNIINDLSDVNATPNVGQVLKWDGSIWTAEDDEAGTGGASITDFSWDNASDLLRITEDGTEWDVYIDNEADDLSDNIINDLSDVDATPAAGQVLKWDGTQWTADDDMQGSGGATITDFTWDNPTDLLRITEDGTDWDVYIDNEADDLSDNLINDLSDVEATPSAGQVLKWDGSQWTAGNDDSGTGGTQITDFEWTDASDLLRITEGATQWDVTIDNEADDLTDNIINDLSDVDAAPAAGQVLKWDGTEWIAGDDNEGASGAEITDFSWDDATDELSITEDGTTWNVTLDNEADDLSDNFINDLNDVNSTPVNGDFLQWNGTEWVAGSPAAASCLTLEEAYNCGGNGAGRSIAADFGAVEVTSSTASAAGMISEHTGNGVALAAINNNTSSQFAAFEAASATQQGNSDNPKGAILGSYNGTGDWSAGVLGQNTNMTDGINAHGVIGIAQGNTSAGIYGSNVDGYGVLGDALYGVFGVANNINGGGVVGQLGVTGATQAGYLGKVGIDGFEYAVYADNDILFEEYLIGNPTTGNTMILNATNGNATFGGTLAKAAGTFKIDHPLDPENKYLYHSFVESPDMMNIYNGIEVFDSEGFAKVILPEYFEALNKDFRYQLSAIGAPMPNLYIAEKINGNAFVIGGGKPGKEVSWEVTGVRKDKFANENRVVDEVDKEDYNKGRYIHPTLFGAPKSQTVHLRNPNEKRSENINNKRIEKTRLNKNAKVKSIFK